MVMLFIVPPATYGQKSRKINTSFFCAQQAKREQPSIQHLLPT